MNPIVSYHHHHHHHHWAMHLCLRKLNHHWFRSWLVACWFIVNWALRKNSSEIIIKIQNALSMKMNLKMWSTKWLAFCLSLSVLTNFHPIRPGFVEALITSSYLLLGGQCHQKNKHWWFHLLHIQGDIVMFYMNASNFTQWTSYDCNVFSFYFLVTMISYDTILAYINSQWLNDTMCHGWPTWTLLQVTACDFFGANPLPEPLVNYYHMNPVKHNIFIALEWRHNGLDSIWNHQPDDCLLNRLFRRRSKKTSKLRISGLCEGNSPGTTQMASNAENVSIWWRHHGQNVLKNTATRFYNRFTWVSSPCGNEPIYDKETKG